MFYRMFYFTCDRSLTLLSVQPRMRWTQARVSSRSLAMARWSRVDAGQHVEVTVHRRPGVLVSSLDVTLHVSRRDTPRHVHVHKHDRGRTHVSLR